MFNKIRSAAMALAAVATLGLGALVATTDSADAARFGGGFSRGGGGAHIGRHIGIHRPVLSHRPIIGRPIFRPGRPIIGRPIFGRPIIRPIRPIWVRPSWCGRWPWGGFRRHCRWPRPIVFPRPVIYPAVAAATYAVAPAVATARPCTCLTKEYTPDNLVVFKDNCTKEVASAPVGNTQVQLPAGPGAVQQ